MKTILFLTTILACCISVAFIPEEQTSLNISSVSPVLPEPTIQSETVAQFIPTDLNSDSTNEDLIRAVGKKTLKSLSKSQFFKKSAIGKTANSIKEATSTEFAGEAPEKNEIQHRVRFSLDPYKAEARVRYTGFFNCSAFYDAFDGDVKVEISEQIADTSIKIQHSTQDQNSSLLLGWTW